jgi:PAS domain S-box-containing protein
MSKIQPPEDDVSNAVAPGSTQPQLLLQATALRTAASAVLITDRSGTILYTNPAFSTLTGFSAEEARGQNPRFLKSGIHGPDFYKQLWTTILSGEAWHGEFTNRRKDGSLYHDEHTITPVRSESGEITHFVAIMHDISEIKRAKAEVQKLNQELETRVRERTAQLEAANRELEAFSYSVSHDLNAPLRHITGFARLLREDLGTNLKGDGEHCLNQIEDAARQMKRLIEHLLEFSRTSRAEQHLALVPLEPLVAEVIEALKKEARGRNVSWKRARLPEVEADPTLLRQVFVNLLSNALKFTRTKGVAEIEIGTVNGQNDEATIFIRDNGVGFDMRYSDKLFGVFQRLHSIEEFEGSGIGLATVQRIINRHGGRVWAEARVNSGATFFFSLPQAKLKQEPKPNLESEAV